MGDEFAIEQLGPASLDGFLSLLTAYLGPVAEVRYRWFYRQNPHGAARTFVARHLPSGRVVGCTSLFPRRIAIGAGEALAALGGDAYVLPEMRRRGLAKRLHEATLATLGDEVAFMFGPPAPDNLRVLKRVGSQEVRALRHFTCPVRGAWVADWLRHRPGEGTLLHRLGELVPGELVASVFDGLQRAAALRFTAHRRRPLLPVARVDGRFDDLWLRARPQLQVAPVRDSAYLQWRFLDQPAQGVRMLALPAPDSEAQLAGYAVVEAREGRLLVHDLLAEGAADMVVMGEALQQLARQQGLDVVSLRLDQQGPYVPSLLFAGFLPTRHPIPFQILAPEGSALAGRAARSPWLFTLGDEDWSGAAL
jgi:hypothetical protein